MIDTARDSKIGSASVRQPPLLSPSASLNLCKSSCFDTGFAWLKIGAPPWHLPVFQSLPVYWDPKPEAFTIPGLHLPILWYGVLFALGFALSFPIFIPLLTRFFLAYHQSKDVLKWRKVATTTADRLTLYIVLATVIGARLGHFLFYESPSRYLSHPMEILQIREGGLASHGAVIAIILALVWFARRYKIEGLDWLKLLDLIAVPAALVGCCIRLGNFINQEVLGTPSTLPWAVLFGHPADGQVEYVPRHPVQIYEALFYLGVFFVLWRLSHRLFFLLQRGKLVGLFLILIFGFRFCIEFFKVEQSHIYASHWMTMGQLLSIPVFLLGIVFFFWEKR
ncbi:MAG: prolipoprotein diacylglyceryl transferase [Chlamydiia bacterium]|nr:prolipoprotein diacylglyceryl transferase [Chlamydiia bacterium]